MTAAARVLHVSQPTVSAQIRKLEKKVGEKLFRRAGRSIELTDVGRIVFRYADEMFTLGEDLEEALRNLDGQTPLRLMVGIVEAFPKVLAHHIVTPALEAFPHLHLEVFTAPPDRLFGRLAVHDLDLVISDGPLPTTVDVQAYNHRLGSSSVSIMATPTFAREYAEREFPACLDGAPFLLPAEDAALRRELRRWFADEGVRPRVVAEVQDSAILQVFAWEGAGMCAVPTAVAAEVGRMYELETLWVLPDVTETFWAISVERRIRNPAAARIREAARDELLLAGG